MSLRTLIIPSDSAVDNTRGNFRLTFNLLNYYWFILRFIIGFGYAPNYKPFNCYHKWRYLWYKQRKLAVHLLWNVLKQRLFLVLYVRCKFMVLQLCVHGWHLNVIQSQLSPRFWVYYLWGNYSKSGCIKGKLVLRYDLHSSRVLFC